MLNNDGISCKIYSPWSLSECNVLRAKSVVIVGEKIGRFEGGSSPRPQKHEPLHMFFRFFSRDCD